MKTKLLIILLGFITYNVQAEIIKFRAPALSGKIVSEQIDLTDWQAVMICRYNLGANTQEVMKYPFTLLKKIDSTTYSLTTKNMSLFEMLPNIDIINCAYKLILIGKDKVTLQNHFGEIILIGSEKTRMSDKEIELIQNKDWVQKTLSEKVKELNIGIAQDGGIINLKEE